MRRSVKLWNTAFTRQNAPPEKVCLRPSLLTDSSHPFHCPANSVRRCRLKQKVNRRSATRAEVPQPGSSGPPFGILREVRLQTLRVTPPSCFEGWNRTTGLFGWLRACLPDCTALVATSALSHAAPHLPRNRTIHTHRSIQISNPATRAQFLPCSRLTTDPNQSADS